MSESVPTVKGKGTLRWGLDGFATITNLEPQKASVKKKAAINKWIKGANGYRASKVIGDLGYELSLEAVYYGGTPPEVSAFLTMALDSGGSTTSVTNLIVDEIDWDYGNENELLLKIAASSAEGIVPSS